jgi:hypothetical protein
MKDAVIPIINMTGISVPLPPNGTFLARGPCRPS